MSSTNVPSSPPNGTSWTVTAPDNVTFTPSSNATDPMGIRIDYDAAALFGATHGIVDIHFNEPERASIPDKDAGLVTPVQFVFHNGLGVPVDGFVLYTANETSPNPPDTAHYHPANYGHFHLVEEGTFPGLTSDVRGQDFTNADYKLPPQPGAIVAEGVIAADGTVTGKPMTLHQYEHVGVNDDFHIFFYPILRSGQQIMALRSDAESHAEGNGGTITYTFEIMRASASGTAGQVDFEVTGAGANPTDAADFAGGILPRGTVQFAAGQTRQTIEVQVVGDNLAEPDETFSVNLSTPSGNGAVPRLGPVTGTITNDDAGVPSAGAPGETVQGTSKADTLVGGPGDDTLRGLGGGDRLSGEGGSDNLDGGPGSDTVDYSADTGPVRVDLQAGRAEQADGAVDTIISIGHVRGTAFDDVLEGNDNVNDLLGLDGNDSLTGRGGADRFLYRSFTQFGDQVTDFQPGSDTIGLARGLFPGGGVAPGHLPETEFGAGRALDYNAQSGEVTLDGALVVTLAGVPAVGAGDFFVL